MEWWVWIAWRFLFSVIHLKLYRVHQKKHETTDPPICIYINRINNRLVFKIKDVYKPELQAPETMNLFGSSENLIVKTKNRENDPSLEVAELLLIRCNWVDNQSYQLINQF